MKLEVARANEMAREAAKNAAEMKSNLDAFMDATGVSAGGQMQRAVRTTDGRVMVEVTSPGTDQRLDAFRTLSQSTGTKWISKSMNCSIVWSA